MEHLPLRVDEDTAFRLMKRYYAKWSRRLLNPTIRRAPEGERLPRFEQIWMPYHVVTVEALAEGKPSSTVVSVDGWTGGFAIFQRTENVLEGDPEGEVFPPHIAQEDAEELARKRTLEYLLRRRGGRKPEITGVADTRLVWFPYWVYYFETRKGKYDIRLIDGATGEVPGNKMRVAVLNAFLAAGS